MRIGAGGPLGGWARLLLILKVDDEHVFIRPGLYSH